MFKNLWCKLNHISKYDLTGFNNIDLLPIFAKFQKNPLMLTHPRTEVLQGSSVSREFEKNKLPQFSKKSQIYNGTQSIYRSSLRLVFRKLCPVDNTQKCYRKFIQIAGKFDHQQKPAEDRGGLAMPFQSSRWPREMWCEPCHFGFGNHRNRV